MIWGQKLRRPWVSSDRWPPPASESSLLNLPNLCLVSISFRITATSLNCPMPNSEGHISLPKGQKRTAITVVQVVSAVICTPHTIRHKRQSLQRAGGHPFPGTCRRGLGAGEKGAAIAQRTYFVVPLSMQPQGKKKKEIG